MREMLVETCEETGEDGLPYRFDYFLLIDQMEVGGGFACESYGVKIAQRGGGAETAIPNVTTSVSRIDELMGLLTRHFVTPATLNDVVADWL